MPNTKSGFLKSSWWTTALSSQSRSSETLDGPKILSWHEIKTDPIQKLSFFYKNVLSSLLSIKIKLQFHADQT